METSMHLKRLEDVLTQENGPIEPEPENAWLNDVGLSNRHTLQKENDKEKATSPQIEAYTLVDYSELLSQQNTPVNDIPPEPQRNASVDPAPPLSRPGMPIEHSHHLWPLMLHLSKQIWQE